MLMMAANVEARATAAAMAAERAMVLAMTAMRVMAAVIAEARVTAAKIACNEGNNVAAKINAAIQQHEAAAWTTGQDAPCNVADDDKSVLIKEEEVLDM